MEILRVALLKRVAGYIVALLCMAFSGCGSSSKIYTIGVDPSWFPLDVAGKEPYVLAFSHELLQKIGHLKKCAFQRMALSWDDLLEAVNKGQCQGILSSLQPYVFNLQTYQFSDHFLQTGPVVVMAEKVAKTEADHLYEKEIAVFSPEDEQLLMQTYPEALMRSYDSLPQALADVAMGVIDGALVDYLRALSYVTDLYAGQLKIVSSTLNQEGLRLVTSAKQNKQLIHLFNEAIKELKQSGEYQTLLSKWKLG